MQGCSPGESKVQPTLSIIVPMYNEEGNIQFFLNRLTQVLTELNVSFECLIVDDGSEDKTWSLLQGESAKDTRIKGLRLSRNFGPQKAVFAGLNAASGRAIVTMDGDMQHPPEVIPRLVEAWNAGYKIVQTLRTDSEDFTLFKRQSSSLFNRVFSAFSDLPMAGGTSDFRLLDASVVKVIRNIDDPDIFMRGLTFWVGFPTETIRFTAAERHSGSTKFNLSSLVRYSTSAIISFSLKPLKFGIWVGLITSVLAFMEMIYIFIQAFRGTSVPGWASTLTIISFMFGILFLILGIIGTYIGKIFEVTRKRPRYIVNETAGDLHDQK